MSRRYYYYLIGLLTISVYGHRARVHYFWGHPLRAQEYAQAASAAVVIITSPDCAPQDEFIEISAATTVPTGRGTSNRRTYRTTLHVLKKIPCVKSAQVPLIVAPGAAQGIWVSYAQDADARAWILVLQEGKVVAAIPIKDLALLNLDTILGYLPESFLDYIKQQSQSLYVHKKHHERTPMGGHMTYAMNSMPYLQAWAVSSWTTPWLGYSLGMGFQRCP